EQAKEHLAKQSQEVIIPSYAAWFDLSGVHENERNALPEFFNGRSRSKTPTVYVEYRDFMINTYRLAPSEYLTVTACRRNLAGDVCAIIRVHAFLEQWGLINYQVDADSRPSNVAPPFTGHFRVSVDTPRGIQPYLPAASSSTQVPLPSTTSGPATSTAPAASAASATTTTSTKTDAAPNLDLRKPLYTSDGVPEGLVVEESKGNKIPQAPIKPDHYHCHTCGVECSRVRYHNLKHRGVSLCPSCYVDGRFPFSFSSADFLRVQGPPPTSSAGAVSDEEEIKPWAEAETLRLLEGIEMFDEDWNKVAAHVGTRSREACVLHFLRIPIEEPYLGASEAELGPLQYARMPFSQADNPVLSVVAFLASVVNPGVASAAAKAALGSLVDPEEMRMGKGKVLEGEEEKGEGEAGTKGKADKAVSEDKDKDGDATMENQPASKDKDASLPESRLQEAAATALASAAAKAKAMASYEEREVRRLVDTLIEAQVRKLELKMRQFEELEESLERQRALLEYQREALVKEKLEWRR
ncbi:SWIRM domain-containing protein, partial [Piptocephalis cylindrospora]